MTFLALDFVCGGGSNLFNNQDAVLISKAMNNQHKIFSAICLMPVILAKVEILNVKRAIVSGTEVKNNDDKGAQYTGIDLTINGKIIAGNAPKLL